MAAETAAAEGYKYTMASCAISTACYEAIMIDQRRKKLGTIQVAQDKLDWNPADPSRVEHGSTPTLNSWNVRFQFQTSVH